MPFSPRFTRVDEKGIIALKYPIITKAYNVEKSLICLSSTRARVIKSMKITFPFVN